jgi:hypothetical protein
VPQQKLISQLRVLGVLCKQLGQLLRPDLMLETRCVSKKPYISKYDVRRCME